MQHYVLKRLSSTANGTFGVLIDINNIPTGIVTLEDPWMNNRTSISCIPAGTYSCRKYSGTKYKDVWILEDMDGIKDGETKGRRAILIHVGNTIDNTEGCILVGSRFGKAKNKSKKMVPGILESNDALKLLRKITGNKDFILHVEEEYAQDYRIGSGTSHLVSTEPAKENIN